MRHGRGAARSGTFFPVSDKAPAKRVRVDLALVDQGLAPSREKARALILAGEVLADDRPVDKAGDLVAADASLRWACANRALTVLLERLPTGPYYNSG